MQDEVELSVRLDDDVLVQETAAGVQARERHETPRSQRGDRIGRLEDDEVDDLGRDRLGERE